MADASYGSLPFAEQIAFFRRKLNLRTNTWLDIWQQAHDHAFVVAGANRMDIVEDFRAAVDRAIADGGTLADFRKDFDRIVAKHGWSYNGGRNWRSRVIYETNLRTSYAAARYEQLQTVKRRRPYWEYMHSDSVSHPRPLHVSWDGLVLHADDPWWNTHYPPNGWGCRCKIHALNKRDLERLGKSGPDTAPPIDMQDVTVGKRGPAPRTVRTPAGIDPGFGYAPGKSVTPQPGQLGVLRAPPGLPTIQAPVSRGLHAAFDADDLRYVLLPKPQAEALHGIERTIVASDVELGRGVDQQGTVRVAVTGTRTRLDLRPYRQQLRGLVLTHNHPVGGGFSFEDVATATAYGMAEIRVVTGYGLYRLAPESGTEWPRALIVLAYKGAPLRRELVAQAVAWQRLAHRRWPGLSQAQLNRLGYDRLMLLLQRQFPNLIYRVVTP